MSGSRGVTHRDARAQKRSERHVYTHKYMHTCIHTYIHTLIFSFNPSFTHAHTAYAHTYLRPRTSPVWCRSRCRGSRCYRQRSSPSCRRCVCVCACCVLEGRSSVTRECIQVRCGWCHCIHTSRIGGCRVARCGQADALSVCTNDTHACCSPAVAPWDAAATTRAACLAAAVPLRRAPVAEEARDLRTPRGHAHAQMIKTFF